MKPSALLLLVHQARSYVYVGLIAQYCRNRDIACIVVSSHPGSDNYISKIKDNADRFWLVAEDDLTSDNVQAAVKEASAEYAIMGVIATYEGYRILMASLNAVLGVKDATPDALATCMDKYICRKTLYSANLSAVDCHIISADNLAALKADSHDYFIKPRRGIGSFACFKLDTSLEFSVIAQFQQQMSSDARFKNIFAGQFDFIAEQFIHGEEYSFEVVLLDGQSYVIGTHAKYVREMFGTTLETGNTLPAPGLSDAEQLAGEQFVASCLASLQLHQGAYHIETRYNRETACWNIIEINARMGGALINQSVEVFTGGHAFLELWVMSLITRCADERRTLHHTLSNLRESIRRRDKRITRAAVFISQYGEPGRTISRICVDQLRRKPDICEIAVTEGTTLPNSARGIFILNALWQVDVNKINDELDSLYTILEEDLALDYQAI